jgi:3-isopropylmalate/(R)-2-methylmalate dehydratase small subunit
MSMQPFTTLDAVAVPLDSPNIDTDQIAPARFLRKPRAGGYGQFLFHDLRLDPQGQPIADFILNRPSSEGVGVLVTDRNFGCGSSREQAVWCLVDYGIRCVIAPSFGDIFFQNSVNHGLLLIRASEAHCDALRAMLGRHPGARIKVDLEAQRYIDPEGVEHRFEIEEARRKRLMLGLDEIGLTLQYEAQITAFEQRFRQSRPWLFGAR